MNKVFKKSWQILCRNSALMQPVILFALFSIIVQAYGAMKFLKNPQLGFFYVILALMLGAAFISGWMNMIKYAVDSFVEVDKKENFYPVYVANYNIETMKKFFVGVGEYFMPVVGMVLISIICYVGVIFLGEWLFKVDYLQIVQADINLSVNKVIPTLTVGQIFFLLFINASVFVLMFLSLFWLPTIFYKTKNPLFALFTAIKYLLKNFLWSAIVYGALFFMFFVLNLLSVISVYVPILPFVAMILFLFGIAFSYILIFTTFQRILTTETIDEINKKDVFVKSCDESENKDEADEK